MVRDFKLFTDDTSLFSVVDDIDVMRRQEWTYQWKMSFNYDRTKPAQGFKFSPKTKSIVYSNLYFKNVSNIREAFQKHIKQYVGVIRGSSREKMLPGIRATDSLSQVLDEAFMLALKIALK